ncbi:hypothetical protein ACLB2K_012954 [Fragaria x ananassa]
MINHRGLPCPNLQEPPCLMVCPVIQPIAPPMMLFPGNTHISLSIPQAAILATPKKMRSVSIKEVPDFPSPSKITGVWRGKEEDDDGGKRARHWLMMVLVPLNPNELRLSVAADGNLSIVGTEKYPKTHGSKNKKQNLTLSPDSMALDQSGNL